MQDNKTGQPTNAQIFLQECVTVIAGKVSSDFTSPLTQSELGLLAQAVKRHMKQSFGMREIMLILWGTSLRVYDAWNCGDYDWGLVWGGNSLKYNYPKRYTRILAHAILCEEVLKRLVALDLYKFQGTEMAASA